MTKERKNDPAAEPTSPSLALKQAEKGPHRSMWELLLEMRVLLPYLARLVPLLDRGSSKASPDLGELKEGIADMQTGRRDLEVQARNQALQLERIEQQMGRLRVVHENSIEESRRLYADMRSLRQSLLTIAVVMVLLLLVTVGMVTYLLIHSAG